MDWWGRRNPRRLKTRPWLTKNAYQMSLQLLRCGAFQGNAFWVVERSNQGARRMEQVKASPWSNAATVRIHADQTWVKNCRIIKGGLGRLPRIDWRRQQIPWERTRAWENLRQHSHQNEWIYRLQVHPMVDFVLYRRLGLTRTQYSHTISEERLCHFYSSDLGYLMFDQLLINQEKRVQDGCPFHLCVNSLWHRLVCYQ